VTVRRLVALLCLLAGALAGGLSLWAPALAAPAGETLIVPIDGTVDDGMAHMVERSIAEARASHARAIVLDVNTFGGLVSAATEIRDALLASDVPVDAYVTRAWSAGALVPLAARHIAIAPAGSIGAAQPHPTTVKTVSALRAEFEATAAHYGRNTELAGAMVDTNLPAPQYKPAGGILTLTGDQARQAGFAEAVEPSLPAALAEFGLTGPRQVTGYTFAENVARFATNTDVSGILLAIGFLGLLTELMTLHVVAGAIGAGALALFFGTHVYAGFSNGFVVGAAVLGLALILFELHVLPGHGVAGVLGVAILVGAVVLAFGVPFFVGALQALAIAIALTALAFAFLRRFIPENAFAKRLMFAGAQGSDYVASADHRALLGRSGVAVSFLRPTGVATFGDVRVDVLTEGDFVQAGTPVRVTRVEGSRIFVRPIVDRV
jgi:membrane-bound serine protease (ClpP class)